MSEGLGDFFKLLAEDKKKKKEEMKELVGEIDIDSIFSQVKESIAEDKQNSEKVTKQAAAFESWLFSETEEEKEEIVAEVAEDFREEVETIEPEPEVEEEIEEDNVITKSIKVLDTIKEQEDPLNDTQFATFDDLKKHYQTFLDRISVQLSSIGGGGIEDAPKTGGPYVRQNQAWSELGNLGIGPNDNINTTGIITAAQFSGDGSGLTGITATGSGVVIQEEGSNVGTAATLNFVGSAVTATISGGVATIGITGGGGGSGITTANINADTLNVTGVATATSFDGNLTGNVTGNSDTATTATTAQGLTGTPNLNVGVVTATAFSGSGANLTNLPSSQLTGALPAISGASLTGITTSQIVGYSAGGGSYDNSDVDSHLNVSGASSGQILSWNGSDYAWVADQTGGGGGGGISLTDLSVTTNSVGTAALTYNNTNGVFSYTPPDLSSYLTSYTETDTLATVTGRGSSTNSDLTFGGNLSVSGVSTVSSKVHVGGGTTFTEDLVVTGDARVTGILSIGTGTIVLDPDNDEILVGDVKLQRSASGTIEIRSKHNVLKDIRARRLISNGMSEDDDGNISITGIVTATTFVKSSGTSSQFLKADGSVDSTSYSTFDGNYNNLTNRPTIPTNNNQLTNGAGYTTFDGDYNNLTNKPTIPTNNSQLTNGAGFISDVVNDTSPQLGGDLQTNGKRIKFGDSTGGLDDRLVIGSQEDMLIYHDIYSSSSMFDVQNGSFVVRTNWNGDDGGNIYLNPFNNDNGVIVRHHAGVELFYNDVKKFETTSAGADVTGDLTLTDTADDSSAGPEFVLYRNSSSPASSDYIGQIKFQGESDSGATRLYAKITGKIGDPTNGSEDGIIEIAHRKNGSNNISGRWNQDNLLLINGTGLSVNGQITAESNLDVTGNITVSGNVDGRDVSADGSKLDGIETSADVTDATNVAAAGAVMESDTTTANMSFVVDEDDMASDSNTKVPTQQSVKAYVDANSGGSGTSTGKAIALSFIFG